MEYLKAKDYSIGDVLRGTISNVTIDNIQGYARVVLHVIGWPKPVMLNISTGQAIADSYGPITEAWLCKLIVIKVELIQLRGRNMPVFRVDTDAMPEPAHWASIPGIGWGQSDEPEYCYECGHVLDQ